MAPVHSQSLTRSPVSTENSIPAEPQDIPQTIAKVVSSPNETAINDDEVEIIIKKLQKTPVLGIDFTRVGRKPKQNNALSKSLDGQQRAHELLNDSSATNLIRGECCGGGCCLLNSIESPLPSRPSSPSLQSLVLPDNKAFASLQLQLQPLTSRAKFSGTISTPVQTVWLEELSVATVDHSSVLAHPPSFVTPHPPHSVYSAPLESARELTHKGAEKRTFHFDLDVTDYPDEGGTDFRVGGAIGVMAPNEESNVEKLFELLDIAPELRDSPILVKTDGGRYPTIWGEDMPRTLESTRRELLMWTVDIQSVRPTKQILRLLAEYTTDASEKTILLYLCSRQGQAAFCEFRGEHHITLIQLLSAFPSCKPDLAHLLGTLPYLTPRWYSLSADPHFHRSDCKDKADRRIVEIAVTVHETDDWAGGKRQGVGSGFLERMAKKYIALDKPLSSSEHGLRIPMFRGLMANPLAREFTVDGPMLLIGAGVGIAPFRGFVQRRLQAANCANKVWVIQGVRDALLDELYSGEWGVHEDEIKKIVESRVGTKKYVQEEVLAQADLVWYVANAPDGRIYVCGSTKGMGEGVQQALIDVAVERGHLQRSEAEEFWKKKAETYQYVKETW